MRHGEIYIYNSPPASQRFDELVTHLASVGISLRDPRSRKIFRCSRVGEQLPTTKKNIQRHLAEAQWTAFNLYLSVATHLFCTIDKLPSGIVRENYDLSGKTEAQSQLVIKAVVELFKIRAARHTAMALVVDRYAQAHLNFHWDDFVLGDVTDLEEWPMFLGFAKTFTKIRYLPATHQQTDCGDYVLFNAPKDGLQI
jgi:hypothetical protein